MLDPLRPSPCTSEYHCTYDNMARETNPPKIPPRPDRLRLRPTPQSPPPSAQPPIPSPPRAELKALPPPPLRTSSSTDNSKKASVAGSRHSDKGAKQNEKESSSAPARKKTAKFTDDKLHEAGQTESETKPAPVARDAKDAKNKTRRAQEAKDRLEDKENFDPAPLPDIPAKQPTKPKPLQEKPQPQLPKTKRTLATAAPETQSLLHADDNLQQLVWQPRDTDYRTHTRSAEARAIYMEAKDHYGKARNHLQEAVRLSVDVLRLTPHVVAENLSAAGPADRGQSKTASSGARYPDYPNIGVQYRALFAPLFSSGAAHLPEKSWSDGGKLDAGVGRSMSRARQPERASNDAALARERAAVARRTAAPTAAEMTPAPTSRAKPRPDAHSPPPGAAAASPAPSIASWDSRSHADKQKRRARPATTRSTVRMRDSSEGRARNRSAASGRRQKKKEEEVDHGIMWFFSY